MRGRYDTTVSSDRKEVVVKDWPHYERNSYHKQLSSGFHRVKEALDNAESHGDIQH